MIDGLVLRGLSGRPLLDTAVDAKMFVNRDEQSRSVAQAVADEFNSLVLSPRGAGATSFLRHIARTLRSARQADSVLFCDGAPFKDTAELLAVIRERIIGPRQVPVAAPALGPSAALGLTSEVQWSQPGLLLREIDDLRRVLTADDELGLSDRRVVLLDTPNPAIVHTLFGRMRDELWAVPVTWVVSGDVDKRAALVEPPADAFFEHVAELDDLDSSAARELLRRRVAADVLPDKSLEEVVRLGGGNPRRLITLAREAAAGGPHWVQHRLEDDARFDQAVASLGRGESMLIAEMRARNEPVSASDQGLQARLGWTRARLAQVLNSLEAANLVVTSYGAGTGRPGRPKKLFQLAERSR